MAGAYVLILRPLAGFPNSPSRRLALALKFAGRVCGLSCRHHAEVDPADLAGVIAAVNAINRGHGAAVKGPNP